MFGLAWTEIGVIGVVAMVLIGPKDLPVAIRAISDLLRKARKMAGEFQGHVDTMVREADSTGAMSEMRQTFNEIRRFDLKGQITKAVDADGTIRATMTENPIADWGGSTLATGAGATGAGAIGTNPTIHVAATPLADIAAPDTGYVATGHVEIAPLSNGPPAFIPPPAALPLGMRDIDPGAPPPFVPPAAVVPAAVVPAAVLPAAVLPTVT